VDSPPSVQWWGVLGGVHGKFFWQNRPSLTPDKTGDVRGGPSAERLKRNWSNCFYIPQPRAKTLRSGSLDLTEKDRIEGMDQRPVRRLAQSARASRKRRTAGEAAPCTSRWLEQRSLGNQ